MRVAIAARENDEGARGLNLIDSANETRLRMADILDKAENDHDWRAAVAAGRTMIAALEFIAKMQGDITDATTVNVLVSPALAQLQEVVLAALARHPAARADVIAALAAVNGPALLEHVPLAT